MKLETKKGFFPGLAKVLDAITGVFEGASCFILLAITLITFMDVVLRKTVGAPTKWGYSITIIGLMWLVLLDLPLNIKNNDQITVTLLTDCFSERTRAVLRVVCNLVSFLFLLVLAYYGLTYTDAALKGKMTSSDIVSYPLWILRIGFPICGILGCLQQIRVLAGDVAGLAKKSFAKKDVWWDSPFLVVGVFLLIFALAVVAMFSKPMLGIGILILLLLFSGAPICFGMGFLGAMGLYICYKGWISVSMVPSTAEPMLTNFIMLAVPMFMFAGIILEKAGIGELLFDFCAKWFGFLPGGLAVATIIACGLFSAMTGVSMAVAATISIIAVKALSAHGYPKELIYGSIGGGALGSFIPPSIGLVIYGYMTGKSVGKLFMAATVPAIIVVCAYSAWAIYYALTDKRMKDNREPPATWPERWKSLWSTLPALLMPVIVLGGIYAGFFTPTEASAVLAVYAFVLALLKRKLTLKTVVAIVRQSASVSSRMMIVASGATILTYLITKLGFAQRLAQTVATMDVPRFVVYLLLILMYTILGMFFDGMTITILTVPVLSPILPSIGIDPIVFGVLLVMLVETAAITPPVGMNLFVIQSVSKDKLSIIAKGNIPFALILLGATILLMFVPNLALWLPSVLK